MDTTTWEPSLVMHGDTCLNEAAFQSIQTSMITLIYQAHEGNITAAFGTATHAHAMDIAICSPSGDHG